MTTEKRAKAFMEHVFRVIEHGDEGHRLWLREKCEALAPELAEVLESVAKDAKEIP